MLRIPRACCECKVCKEARRKGAPYERLGQSLYLPEHKVLFETPEDINEELNKNKIKEVEHLFYSHWHPDHTSGNRIIETLRHGRKQKPIKLYMTVQLIKDFKGRVPAIFYWETQKYCSIQEGDGATIGDLEIKIIPLTNGFANCFIIQGEKKVVYCPCHAKHMPLTEELSNADLLIMNCGRFEKTDVTSFEDNLRIAKALNAKETLLTHIEEDYGKGYDDYCKLEKRYPGIKFAHDGYSKSL